MKKEASQGILPLVFEDPQKRDDVTARAGLALVVEAAMALGVDEAVEKELVLNKRQSGYSESEKVEALILLQSAGGDCVEDIRQLSSDVGLERMLGWKLPSPDVLHDFLLAFHEDALWKDRPEEGAFVPGESSALKALEAVNRKVVDRAGKGVKATVDLDATIIESHKRDALFHYKGGRGYQPVAAIWAEEDLVLADEFRDGNVPAGMDPLTTARRAFAALPVTVKEYYFRGDSACYEEHLLKWLTGAHREGGPEGEIQFTISADMTESLSSVCKRVEKWELLENRLRERVEWAEVTFVPGDWPKDAKPLRYVALRFTQRQRDLFEEKDRVRHLAVVSNRWDLSGPDLIRWHWEKAGTIELVHDVMKNELGGGTLPSGLFGANAAWYRFCGLTYNVMSYLRKKLPERLQRSRPKRLRFELFTMPAKISGDASELRVRGNVRPDLLSEIINARGKMLADFENRQQES